MDAVRLGVVGCGVIGPTHMKAAVESPLVELVAVADLIEERGRKAAEEYGVPKVYIQGDDLIEDADVEAVVLAMPAGARSGIGLHALKAGKHLLLEKPVAMNAGEVREMIQAQGDLVAACCSCRFRLTESARVAADLVATGALGDLRVVHFRAIRGADKPPEQEPPPWRESMALNGGGILVNWSCYDLDYMLGLTGWSLRPRTVLAQWWPVAKHLNARVAPGSDADAHFAALVRCDGGTVLSIERGEFCAAQGEAAWRIVGTKGSLRLMMSDGERIVIHDDSTSEEGVVSTTVWQEDTDTAFNTPASDLAEAIREGRPPATTLEQALVLQEITDAVYASAESGEAVHIP